MTEPAPIWTHHEAIVNGVRLHYVTAGEPDGPLVVLLHGFPEFWYSWRHQIMALAQAGCHVVAPDMRGYNLSEKPPGVHNYHIDLLTDDMAALIRHMGYASAVVAGHDWGGVVAWYVPMRYPDLVDKLIILNAPHPAVMLRELRKPSQLKKSWYTFAFQLPGLPEFAMRVDDYAMLREILRRDPVNRKTFTKQDIRRYVEAASQPGALTAAINYYRAIYRLGPLRAQRKIKAIATPTLLIWGDQDRYLGLGMTQALGRWVPNLRVAHLPHASHWVQNEDPAEVNRLMVEFIGVGTAP